MLRYVEMQKCVTGEGTMVAAAVFEQPVIYILFSSIFCYFRLRWTGMSFTGTSSESYKAILLEDLLDKHVDTHHNNQQCGNNESPDGARLDVQPATRREDKHDKV